MQNKLKADWRPKRKTVYYGTPGGKNRTLFDINHSNSFLDPSLRLMEIKTKINYWDQIKLKSFCGGKEIITETKRQLTEWEKIITNKATDEQSIVKICKQLLQLQIRKPDSPVKELGTRPKRAFLQRTHTDDRKVHEKMLNVIREMQIKTTMRFVVSHTSQNGHRQKFYK